VINQFQGDEQPNNYNLQLFIITMAARISLRCRSLRTLCVCLCITQSLGFSLISLGSKSERYTSYKGPTSLDASLKQDSQPSALTIRGRKTWTENYESVKEYVKNIGTNDSSVLGSRLRKWLLYQRKRKRDKDLGLPSKLTDVQEEKLESFRLLTGDLFDFTWHQRYEELVDYRKEHGHSMVLQGSKNHKDLGMWVHTQRQLYKRRIQGKLPKGSGFSNERLRTFVDWNMIGCLLFRRSR
jgi:hypothetical protein